MTKRLRKSSVRKQTKAKTTDSGPGTLTAALSPPVQLAANTPEDVLLASTDGSKVRIASIRSAPRKTAWPRLREEFIRKGNIADLDAKMFDLLRKMLRFTDDVWKDLHDNNVQSPSRFVDFWIERMVAVVGNDYTTRPNLQQIAELFVLHLAHKLWPQVSAWRSEPFHIFTTLLPEYLVSEQRNDSESTRRTNELALRLKSHPESIFSPSAGRDLLKGAAFLGANIEPDSARVDELIPSPAALTETKGQVFLAGRAEATKALMLIHQGTYNMRLGIRVGPRVVPLIDGHYGQGKTRFGKSFLALAARHFLGKEQRKSLLEPPDGTPTKFSADFLHELSAARTLYVNFRYGELAREDTRVDTFIKCLKCAVRAQWQSDLAPNGTHLGTVLYDLTSGTPVFLALDGIGAAFELGPGQVAEERNQFLLFFRRVCHALLEMPKLYFLLIGQGEFLGSVNQNRIGGSLCELRRVNLEPLIPLYIKETIQCTLNRGISLPLLVEKALKESQAIETVSGDGNIG